ncbi:MAG TPA: response regulator [Longimicrobiales bacterium]|nr:response regulator [Longimicrobiales bacterium]
MILLLVDDDPMILLLAGRVLEAAGYVVRAAGSGADALAQARREAPDALLLDLFLDDVDGDELLPRLRDVPGLAGVPVAFLTGQDDSAEVARLTALGARGVIAKPFDPEALAGEVRRLLGPP